MYVDAPLMERSRLGAVGAGALPQPNVIATTPGSQTGWTLFQTGGDAKLPVVTPNAGRAPDGTMTATRVQLYRGTGYYSILRLNVPGPATQAQVTDSVYLKLASGSAPVTVGVRLASVISDARTAAVVTNQWQRFKVTAPVTPAGQTFDILLWAEVPSHSTSADILVWNARADVGTEPVGDDQTGALAGITPVQWGVGLSLLLLALSGKSISLGGR